jgi:hypothetical protein
MDGVDALARAVIRLRDALRVLDDAEQTRPIKECRKICYLTMRTMEMTRESLEASEVGRKA